MVTLSGIGKAFGHKELFRDVSARVNRGDAIGLVGPNGAGKSTLFNILLGHDEPDSGQIQWERGLKRGFLPQESAPVGDETVLELATSITDEIGELRRKLKGSDQSLSGEAAGSDTGSELGADWRRFEELGGFDLEPKAKKILKGLSFRESDFNRSLKEFSGGWVMRAHLARLLVLEPDLLMLDEPTNHLDLESLNWFRDYLRHYSGSLVVISHDRDFLNQLVRSIWEIRQCQLFSYQGNYDSYVTQKEAAEVQQMAAYKNQQKQIAHLQSFVDRFRAKASKASQAQSKLKQIERMDLIEAPVDDRQKIHFRFPQPKRSGQRVISLKKVCQAYGDRPIYVDLDFEAERGQRMVLVGPNGAGKSTLLRILAGVLPFQSGEKELGHNVTSGYYAQYRVENLQPERTVLEEALDTPQSVTETYVRTVLGGFLFSGDDVFKKVKVLSGGEKSRLALVKLLLDPPNLLLMDEPTTHLDMASIEALIQALTQFEGTLIFISHDVYFIHRLANLVVHVKDGVIRRYPGDYQYYLDKSKEEEQRLLSSRPVEEVVSDGEISVRDQVKERKRLEAQARQEKSKRRKEIQARFQKVEKEISRLEDRQQVLTQELEKPETYDKPGAAVAINRELMEVQDKLEELTLQWEVEGQALAELE